MSTENVDFDLDALAPTPKQVRIGGVIYALPGDMPLELFIKVNAFDQRLKAGEDEGQVVEELYDEVLALFQEHQPDMDSLPRGVGLTGLLGLVVGTYSGQGQDDDAAGAEGKPPAGRGSTKTRPPAARRQARAKAS